jgi:hypothetical protein
MAKKDGGWTGSALLPFVLLSEKADSNFLVVGISPLASLAGGEELSAEQQVCAEAVKLCVVLRVCVWCEQCLVRDVQQGVPLWLRPCAVRRIEETPRGFSTGALTNILANSYRTSCTR